MGPVYHAGYKMGEAGQFTGVIDDIFLRCLTIEKGKTRVAIVSFDLIGLFSDFTKELAGRLKPHGIKRENLLVATTHTHAGPDSMGLWGPSLDQSGYNEKYAEFLLKESAEAVEEAIKSARPAEAWFSYEEKNLGVANYRRPGELNLALWLLLFKAGDRHIGSLMSYTAQPELTPRDDDKISSDYPGEACRLLDDRLGGITLFMLGSCGGMEPEGCEKGYDVAHSYGRKLADAITNLSRSVQPVEGDRLEITMAPVELPIENQGFQLMMESGVIRTSQRPPIGYATVSMLEIGDITILTLPGESFPGVTAGIGKKGRTLFVNQVNDSLGYFIPPDQFNPEPKEWAEGHHFTGHELESLGRESGGVIRRALLNLTNKASEGHS